MTIKTCAKCGENISTRAPRCPDCGSLSTTETGLPRKLGEEETGPPISQVRVSTANLEPCNACGNQISRNAATCFSCGEPNRHLVYRQQGGRNTPGDIVAWTPCESAVNSGTRASNQSNGGRANVGMLLGSFIPGAILFSVGTLLCIAASDNPSDIGASSIFGAFFFLIGMAGLVFGTVLSLIYLHRIWSMIQKGMPRTSPGKAVGFLFIPLFSHYWSFEAFWGLSKDYNAFVREYMNDSPQMPEGLFLSLPILTIGLLVPFLNAIVAIPLFVIYLIVFKKICEAINSLSESATQLA